MEIEGNKIYISPAEALALSFDCMEQGDQEKAKFFAILLRKFQDDSPDRDITEEEVEVAVIGIPYTKSMVEFIAESLERTRPEWEESGRLLLNAQSCDLSPAANQRRTLEYKKQQRKNRKSILKIVNEE